MAHECEIGVTLASLLPCEVDFGATLKSPGPTFVYEGDPDVTLVPPWAYFLHSRVTLGTLWRHFGVNVGM